MYNFTNRQLRQGLRIFARIDDSWGIGFPFHSHVGIAAFMSDRQYTKFQQKVIERYYDNRDSIALQRVQELVTELYLSEGKKRQKHWETVANNLEKLGVAKVTIAHLPKQDKPELVAELVQKLMAKAS